jgi:hypothetical protein
MTSILTGFTDSNAWERRTDGIYAVARDGSWAERVRAGQSIDALLAPQAEAVPAPLHPGRDALFEPTATWPFHLYAGAPSWDEDADSVGTTEEDFDAYFEPVEPRHIARTRRAKSAVTKPVKAPKYGPKVSKTRTVAATVMAEPVTPSGHLTHDNLYSCFVCESPQSTYVMNAPAIAKAKACDHCSPAFKKELAERKRADAVMAETMASAQRVFTARWLTIGALYAHMVSEMADFVADVEITEEDLELERQLRRQRDARYER